MKGPGCRVEEEEVKEMGMTRALSVFPPVDNYHSWQEGFLGPVPSSGFIVIKNIIQLVKLVVLSASLHSVIHT